MELYWVQGYKYTWSNWVGLVSCSSSFGVKLKSESTIDATMGLAVVQVDVHLGVTKGATATITTNLEKFNTLGLFQKYSDTVLDS